MGNSGRKKATADEEAIEWVLRLREDADDADLKASFQLWLQASPDHAAAWADTALAYDLAGRVRPEHLAPVRIAPVRPVLPMVPGVLARAWGPRTVSRMGWPRRHKLAVAASIAATVIVIENVPFLVTTIQADYTTETGEMRTVRLADGSIATLAPQTALAVRYATQSREIRLLRGQAWFDVRRNPTRPFYVRAKEVTTSVLGTAFDVKVDERGVSTEVERGAVRVDRASSTPPVSERVAAGESLRISIDGVIEHTRLARGQVAAWRDHQIIAYNKPAGEVVNALRPWFRGVIVVANSQVARRRVTGVYATHNPTNALEGITMTVGGRVTMITPWVAVVS